MSEILDRAILIGVGLEKKAKDLLDELQQAGKNASTAEKAAKEGAPHVGQSPEVKDLIPKQVIENRVVEEGVRALKDLISLIDSTRGRFEKEAAEAAERVLERLHVPTKDEMEVVKEMARIARERADDLEKRVRDLEEKLRK